jgi:hypothetical protein
LKAEPHNQPQALPAKQPDLRQNQRRKTSAGNPHPIKDQMQKEPTAQTEGQHRQQITPTRRPKRSKEDEKRPLKVTDTKAEKLLCQ